MLSSKVVQNDISSCSQEVVAAALRNQADGSIPLVLIPSKRGALSMIVNVPFECCCLQQNSGVPAGVAEPGIHLWKPSQQISHIVSMRYNSYNAHTKDALTSDGVSIGVDTVLTYLCDP